MVKPLVVLGAGLCLKGMDAGMCERRIVVAANTTEQSQTIPALIGTDHHYSRDTYMLDLVVVDDLRAAEH